MIYTTKSESETADLGRKIGEQLSGGEIITLSGDLGAGKTALTKGIALGLGVCETVVSPTFTLMTDLLCIITTLTDSAAAERRMKRA